MGNHVKDMKMIYGIYNKLNQKSKEFDAYQSCKENGFPALVYSFLYCNFDMLRLILYIQPPSHNWTTTQWQNIFSNLMISGRMSFIAKFNTICHHLINQGVYTQEQFQNILPIYHVGFTDKCLILFNALITGHIPSAIATIKNVAETTGHMVHLCTILHYLSVALDKPYNNTWFGRYNLDAPLELRLSRTGFIKNLAKKLRFPMCIDSHYNDNVGNYSISVILNNVTIIMMHLVKIMEEMPLFDVNTVRMIRSFIVADKIDLVFPDFDNYIFACPCPMFCKQRANINP
jgi:hypothetical protein